MMGHQLISICCACDPFDIDKLACLGSLLVFVLLPEPRYTHSSLTAANCVGTTRIGVLVTIEAVPHDFAVPISPM